MSAPISLNELASEFEILPDEWRIRINKQTGEIITYGDEELMHIEEGSDSPDWMKEHLSRVREALNSSDYLELPGKFQFDEYDEMERFALSLSDPQLSDLLLENMRGRGAFRRFKDTLMDHDIEDQWFAWRKEAIKAFLADFLEEEGVPWRD